MSGVERVTDATLDVIEALLRGYDDDVDLHGWAVVKAARRPGPTVYRAFDRLEASGWLEGRWEDQNEEEPSRPRRRYYRLTPTGAAEARALVGARRPAPQSRRQPGLAFTRRWRPAGDVG